MSNVKKILLAACAAMLVFAAIPFVYGSKAADDRVPLIPRTVLFGNPEKAGPSISPDGTKLAYLAPDANNVLNVWIAELHPSGEILGKAIPVTSDQKRGITDYIWQFDNEHILYLQDFDGDENRHLYQTNIRTKITKDLTPFAGSKADIVDYDYKFPQEILVQMNNRNKALFDVYRIRLDTGETILDTENPGNVIGWIADHNLQVRAAQSYAEDGSVLLLVRDSTTSPWRRLASLGPNEIGGEVVAFSPDNDSLYVLSSIYGNTVALLEFPLSGENPHILVEDPRYDLSSVWMHPTAHSVEAVGLEKERFSQILLDPSLEDDFKNLTNEEQGIFKVTGTSLSNRKWIVAYISDRKSTRYYLYDRASKKNDFLFSVQPALDRYRLSPMEPVSFTARDGMTIYGYATFPAGKKPENLPTVLLVHGGPWARDTWGLQSTVQWLANRGYAVLQINYRASTGYGKDYENAGNKEWGGKMHTDLLDGKKWMIDKGYSDPGKVAIYGGSYGGYATLAGLAFTPEEFCCGVDIVGPSNIITLLRTLPPYWIHFKSQNDLRIGNPETEEEFLRSRSPLFKADSITKPLLIGHGANDPRVKQSESDQIVEAMRNKNIPVEYLLFPDEGHGFARPENRLKFIAAAEEFLAKYLHGRLEMPSKEENWESLKK